MRRLLIIVSIILLLGFYGRGIYEFVFVNDGVSYFSSNPFRLIMVIAAAVLVGIVIVVCSRLSLPTQRRIQSWGLASLGLVVLAGAGFFVYVLVGFGFHWSATHGVLEGLAWCVVLLAIVSWTLWRMCRRA
jgi:drug/metabolite transporter (DMT)-like permease